MKKGVDAAKDKGVKAAAGAANSTAVNPADSVKRTGDSFQKAKAEGDSGGKAAAKAAGTAAVEATAAAGNTIGVPAGATRSAAKVLVIAGGVGVALLGFLFMIFMVSATLQAPDPAAAFPSHAERDGAAHPDIMEAQRNAAVANDIPPGVLWALSLAATENGKFSPYPDDTVDRAPQFPGIRRPNAGESSAGAAQPTPAPAAGAVTVVGDSLCEPGAAGDAIRAELEAAGRTVASADCVRGRPLAGAGVEALAALGSDVSTVVVSLGTNDLPGGDAAAFGANVQKVLDAAPGVSFVWINFAASAHADAAAAFNAELTRIAAATPRLVIADVAAQVKANPDWQAADGVHLTGAGYSARAKVAASAASGAGAQGAAGGAWPPNPDGTEISVWPRVTPNIGDPAAKPAGPYLIQPRALAEAGIDEQAFDFTPGNPTTATDFIADELATIRDALIEDGTEYDLEDADSMKAFWAEAVSRLPVADPRQVECRTPDRGPAVAGPAGQAQVAVQISDLWFCEINTAERFRTLTGVSRDGEEWTDILSSSRAALTVTREAAQVAWAFSKWGTEPCDAAADVAGVFPLTADVFNTYAADGDRERGRCDAAANIRAAARAFVATEKVTPGERADGATDGGIGDRSNALGAYAPMIGGWLAMPWALGGPDGIAAFATEGPRTRWEPSDACIQSIDTWLATASDDDVWAAGNGDLATAPTCDAPEGGGPNDPAWVAVVVERASSSAAATEAAAELGGTGAWAEEQEQHVEEDGAEDEADDTEDSHEHTAPDPEDAARRAANLRGVATAAAGGDIDAAGRPVLSRVTTNGVAPTGMPPMLELDPAEGGTPGYADIVVGLAYDLGGLVAGEGAAYDENGADPLARLAEFRLNPPGGGALGAGGSLGDEIPFAALFNEIAPKYGIDPRFLAAVAWAESNFAPDVVNCSRGSSAGAQGLMQFMPGTARGFGIDPCDPRQAIDGAARYYQELYGMFGRWDLALAAYNAGPGNVRKYGGVPPFTETRNYVTKIMAKWEEHKAAYPDQLPVGPIGGAGGVASVPGGRMVNTASRGQVCVVEVPSAKGMIVNCAIAGSIEQMVRDAAAAGVTLRGGAHRPVEIQIQLRQQRCPGRVYDKSCKGSPPTAIPGRSMHETGEAIDFAKNGRSLNRSDVEYHWLINNSERYGIVNWPVEPWHYSTNGK